MVEVDWMDALNAELEAEAEAAVEAEAVVLKNVDAVDVQGICNILFGTMVNCFVPNEPKIKIGRYLLNKVRVIAKVYSKTEEKIDAIYNVIDVVDKASKKLPFAIDKVCFFMYFIF